MTRYISVPTMVSVVAAAAVLASAAIRAEDVDGVERMLCAATQVHVCIENDSCYAVTPAEMSIPDFIIIDTEKKSLSTTRSSPESRSTRFSTMTELTDSLLMQGMERGRAFSVVIDKASGRMTVAVSRNGLSVSVFGSCTDADLGN